MIRYMASLVAGTLELVSGSLDTERNFDSLRF
jgi:hypothetical protein